MQRQYLNRIDSSASRMRSNNKVLSNEEIAKASSFEALSVPRMRNGAMDFGASLMEGYSGVSNYMRMGATSSSDIVAP